MIWYRHCDGGALQFQLHDHMATPLSYLTKALLFQNLTSEVASDSIVDPGNGASAYWSLNDRALA
jgi:hypothetical protein